MGKSVKGLNVASMLLRSLSSTLRSYLRKGTSGLTAFCPLQTSKGKSCLLISVCDYSSYSEVKQRTYWQYLKRKIIAPPAPPYFHVCQVGDPVLRGIAKPVNPSEITSPDMQKLVKTLIKVMRKVDCVGLSAPQVGVPLQVLVLEFTEQKYNESSLHLREIRQLAHFPLKVFVNPSLRVLDSRSFSFPEGCASLSGFSACVPRYQAVEISGLNEKGEPVSWQASGWPARIIQHEVDHLNGVLYIDKMDSRTFVNSCWMESNE
ncbi:peptide deformylase, mitochondrial isoform X2 [Protopterus annectens]|uniref:peptide deformylase, mitochondrial isoform X2 n=1 Tax=Protopterus annectens TaxID=7888 RepID=UPI001CFB2404|nr:peptide deformylase, mitochondrial isoform X2 [Protopterus annectens]